MDIYDKDPFVKLKNDIVQLIKNENQLLDENLTFAEVIDIVPLLNRARKKRIDLILQDAEHSALYTDLYNFLKGLPFADVRKIYLDKNSLIDDKKDDPGDNHKRGSRRDNLIKHLFKIQELIYSNCKRFRRKFFIEFTYITQIVNS